MYNPPKYHFDKFLNSKKMFALYLKDQNDNLLIFESNQLNSKIIFEQKFINETAQAEDDYLWFTKILEPIKIEQINPPITFQPQSIHSSSSQTLTYSTQYTIAGSNWREYAYARIEALISDVPSVGLSQAQTRLTLHEYTTVDGTFYSNDSAFKIQNPISHTNVDLEGKIALGNNTSVTSLFWNGQYYTSSSLCPNPNITAILSGRFGAILLRLTFY